MTKVQVVAVCNRVPTEPYYKFNEFQQSLRNLGVEPTILGWQQHWGGLMTKPRHLRRFLRDGKFTGDLLIVCDAWDIFFQRHPDEAVEDFQRMGAAIVFNAERNCFPRGDLAPQFPDPGTPWRYLNSGFMMGAPSAILALVESMRLDEIKDDHRREDGTWVHPNDQEYFMLAYLEQPVKMSLDVQAQLCQSMHGSTEEELDLSGPLVRNLVTDTVPVAVHFNGGSKNTVMPPILKKFGF